MGIDTPPMTFLFRAIRRRLRFRLRTLALATMIAAIWLGHMTAQRRARDAAIEAIVRVGGVVHFADPGAAWPIGPVDEYLDLSEHASHMYVSRVPIPQIQINDPSVLTVTPLSPCTFQIDALKPGATTLILWDTDKRVHEIGVRVKPPWSIARLASDLVLGRVGLHEVDSVAFEGNDVTDADLIHLQALPELELVDLCMQARITDAGIPALALLANLETLDLSSTSVTPAGAARLRQALPRCNVLNGDYTKRGVFSLPPLGGSK